MFLGLFREETQIYARCVRYYLELFLGGGRYENPRAKLCLSLFAKAS